jgi:hypothetical protein
VPGEHPRLLVRKEGVAALREAAQTDWGRRVADRIRQALKLTEKLAIAGRNREILKEAGFKAAGHGAAHLVDGDAASADAAREIVLREILGYPLPATLDVSDRVSRLHGTALAYDLCFDAWDEAARAKVCTWLLKESRALLREVDAAGAAEPDHVTAWASAGLAEMAVLGDSDPSASLGAGSAARRRIEACEQAVLGYLDRYVGDLGFDSNGESVREAALASGVLPFVRAERLVLGRDHTAHPALRDTFVPLVYQCVPEVGMAVTGPPTATVDRSGLFALAGDLVPAEHRPAVRWLFDQLEGQKHLGIIRPHQGLSMLTSGLDTITPAPPGDDWPRFVRSDRAGYAVFRTRWKDADDIVAVLYNGALRLLGLGGTWAAHAGFDARGHGHDPGAASLDNVFGLNPGRQKRLPRRFLVPVRGDAGIEMRPPGGGPNAWLLRRGGTVYRVRQTGRLADARADAPARLGSATFVFGGEAVRLEPTFEARVTDDLVNRPNDWATRLVPEGGPFEGERTFGVDYTGLSGAPAVFVVADRLTGVAGAQRAWVLHVGPDLQIATDGATFKIMGHGATLCGTIVYPADVTLGSSSAGRAFNYLAAETTGERIEVVLTLQRGEPPKVSATAGGLAAGVKVGKRVVRLEERRIRFAE